MDTSPSEQDDGQEISIIKQKKKGYRREGSQFEPTKTNKEIRLFFTKVRQITPKLRAKWESEGLHI